MNCSTFQQKRWNLHNFGSGARNQVFRRTVTITCTKLVLTPYRAFLFNGPLHCWCCNDSISPSSLMKHWVSFCHIYPWNEDPFLKRPSFCTLLSLLPKEQEAFLSITLRQPSVVLSSFHCRDCSICFHPLNTDQQAWQVYSGIKSLVYPDLLPKVRSSL